ncbi:MAG TPA: sulfate ABC transporter permease subunit CysT, partial [Blastocatellia bacterium]|nr:sulfate ABC transporter permease subunit CysT [Blastocatellia bacterium]
MSAASENIMQRPVYTPPWSKWGLRATASLYLVLIIALPLGAILEKGLEGGAAGILEDISRPAAWAALKLTVTSALAVTLINAVMGTLTAYVIVRYDFPGRSLLNGLVDIPFAIPTLVTGVMLVALYGPQRTLGAWLSQQGFQVIFATPAVILALLVVTYPFVIRAVQPVLMHAEKEQEEAAYTLGASRLRTFRRIVLPTIRPAIVTGSLLSFARALGEFGSIVVVAGNIPLKTLTAPVYVYGQIESQDARGASSVSLVLLMLSFALIMAVDRLQQRQEKK